MAIKLGLLWLSLFCTFLFGPQYCVYLAKIQAQSQVERAKGAAEANEILAKSIEGKPELVKYLFVKSLETNPRAIYVPTESNLPVLEATRLKK